MAGGIGLDLRGYGAAIENIDSGRWRGFAGEGDVRRTGVRAIARRGQAQRLGEGGRQGAEKNDGRPHVMRFYHSVGRASVIRRGAGALV